MIKGKGKNNISLNIIFVENAQDGNHFLLLKFNYIVVIHFENCEKVVTGILVYAEVNESHCPASSRRAFSQFESLKIRGFTNFIELKNISQQG